MKTILILILLAIILPKIVKKLLGRKIIVEMLDFDPIEFLEIKNNQIITLWHPPFVPNKIYVYRTGTVGGQGRLGILPLWAALWCRLLGFENICGSIYDKENFCLVLSKEDKDGIVKNCGMKEMGF